MYHMRVLLQSEAPYRQRRKNRVPKNPREKDDAHEERTWKETVLYNGDGYWEIPASQFKAAIMQAARYLKQRVPGMGTSTYIQNFVAGVSCIGSITLPYTRETLPGEWEFVSSTGERGRGKRVDRCFATCPSWEGETEWLIYDDLITEDVFVNHLRTAGLLVGIGCWRPQTGGAHGRFKILEADQVALS